MKKIISLLVLLLAMALFFGLAACGEETITPVESENGEQGEAPEAPEAPEATETPETITWIYGDSESATGNEAAAIRKWQESVTEATNGVIQFEYYPSSSLGAETDLLERVSSGAQDAFGVSVLSFENQFRYMAMFGLPLIPYPASTGFDDMDDVLLQATDALWDLYDMYSEDFDAMCEKQGVKLLNMSSNHPSLIATLEPVHTVADLSGLTIRANGSIMTSAVGALGANPISLPAVDVYESAQRGMLDGLITPYSAVGVFKFYEVCDYYNLINMQQICMGIFVSLDKWNELTPELQEAVQSASGRTGSKIAYASATVISGDQTTEVLDSDEYEFYRPTEEEQEEFRTAIQPTIDEWIDASGENYPKMREIYDALVELLETNY